MRSPVERDPSTWSYPIQDGVYASKDASSSGPDQKVLLRKEVIQPHLPIRLPCYDLVPLAKHTFGAFLPKVGTATSGALNSIDFTGGVYKARERIHRSLLICDY